MKQLLILSLTAISFLSCSKSDDSITETSIFGTWKVVGIKTGNDVIPSSTPPWETIEDGHEVTYTENFKFFYNNSLFCNTLDNPSDFIIEIDENDNIIHKDYDCSGEIEFLNDEWATFYFEGKYLIETSLYFNGIVSTSFKYIRVQKDDNNPTL